MSEDEEEEEDEEESEEELLALRRDGWLCCSVAGFSAGDKTAIFRQRNLEHLISQYHNSRMLHLSYKNKKADDTTHVLSLDLYVSKCL